MSVEEPVRSSIKKELRINQERREHVVECYQTFYCDGRISIVLEYMDGGSLADVLKHQGKIGERQLAAVSKQVHSCELWGVGWCSFLTALQRRPFPELLDM